MRPDNPVHGVVRFADGKRERRLTEAEYSDLGEALRKAEIAGVWPPAIAAARLLALTGWRRNEALELRWEEIDLDRRTAKLPDTKTGRSTRPLSHAACDVLRHGRKIRPFRIPGNARRRTLSRLQKDVAANNETWWAPLERNTQRASTLIRFACRRPRILRRDHWDVGWT